MNSKNIPTEYVDSGKYIVSGPAEKVLAACLGSCVGIAVFDRTARVGGLYHILLPEPPGTGLYWQRACYARTGLPEFLEDLCAAGADKQRLQAVVGGGALVRPVSKHDFDLDIGGRTVETVFEILNENGIPIRKSETGGYFGCRLLMNMQSFTTNIEPLGMPETEPDSIQQPTPEEIDAAIQRVQPIPQAALKLIRRISTGDYTIDDITGIVRNDQVISARIISLCNSALFSLPSRVDSIQRALVLLGEKQLLQIALMASVDRYFSEDAQGYSLCRGGLFHHSIRSAMISAALARMYGRIDADAAYTAGLLHDIGKSALDQYIAGAYPQFYRGVQEDGREMTAVEQDVLGITHAEAGRRLAEMWSLPGSLIECIARHHEPEKAESYPELTSIVYLANVILCLFNPGDELERIDASRIASSLERLGLHTDEWARVINSIPQNVFVQTMLF